MPRPAASNRLASGVSRATAEPKFTSIERSVSAALAWQRAWSGSTPCASSATSSPPRAVHAASTTSSQPLMIGRVEQGGLDPRGTAGPEVGGHGLEAIGVPRRQEEPGSVRGVDAGGFRGDRGRGPDDRGPGSAAQEACTRRQNEEENLGSWCGRNRSSRGKNARKLSGLMRASLAG